MSTYQTAKKNKAPKIDCPFCEWVQCYQTCKDCENCGWNPKVAAKRLRVIKESLKRENKSKTRPRRKDAH